MLAQRIAVSRVRGVLLPLSSLGSFVNLTPSENITISQEVLLLSFVDLTPSENITLSRVVPLPPSSLGNSPNLTPSENITLSQ